MTIDYGEAVATLCDIQGIRRILTRFVPLRNAKQHIRTHQSSGHSKSVVDSKSLGQLRESFSQVGRTAEGNNQSPITLLVGSGINSGTVGIVLNYLAPCLEEIHLSGGHWIEGGMWHRPEQMNMGVPGYDWHLWRTSEEAIREVKTHVDEFITANRQKMNMAQ